MNTKSATLALALVFSVSAAACSSGDGAKDPSDRTGNLTGKVGDETNDGTEEPVSNEPGNGDDPVSDVPDGPACEAGFAPEGDVEGARCASTFGGLCFEDEAAACACAGCGVDACLIAESYPTQVRCESPPPPRASCSVGFDPQVPGETRTCHVWTQGLCFEGTEDACRCSCGVSDCAIAESYPYQVACR